MSTPSPGSDSKTSGTIKSGRDSKISGASKSGQDSKTSGKSETKSKVCHPECPTGIDPDPMPCSPFACNFDIEKDPLTCVMPVCPTRLELPPSPADSDIEIQLEEIHNMCCVKSCDTATKVKDFIADGVSRKKITKEIGGDDPCFCDCVCTFRFSNKTSYCPVCGGYECLGDDMRYQPAHIKPHPCPVYHKLYDKKYIKVESPWPEEDQNETLSTKSSRAVRPKLTKSTTDKKIKDRTSEERQRKSVDVKREDKPQEGDEEDKASKGEGDKKKTKKSKKSLIAVGPGAKVPVKKEDLKKKYHYPPVPRNMGWNWLAEDIPGMKVSKCWKPGAISNRLFKQLNTAKRPTIQTQQEVKPKKKANKKRVEDKPTLLISKKNGEYRVEMQMSPEDSDINIDQCDPLVYRISRLDNEERIQTRLRKRYRLVKEAIDKVLVDPYNPEICEKTCLRAYKEAVGLADPNNSECSCTEDEDDSTCSCCNGEMEDDDSSECSSMDLEWELHFSPPIAFHVF